MIVECRWWPAGGSRGGCSVVQRDLDLVRRLLLIIEGERAHKAGVVPMVEGHDDTTVEYHLHLMQEAGLLCHFEAKTRDSYLEPDVFLRLSWAGHEWLELVRDVRHWQAARQKLRQRTGCSSFLLLRTLLEHEAKDRLMGTASSKGASPVGSRDAAPLALLPV
jgi:hypothetical protein